MADVHCIVRMSEALGHLSPFSQRLLSCASHRQEHACAVVSVFSTGHVFSVFRFKMGQFSFLLLVCFIVRICHLYLSLHLADLMVSDRSSRVEHLTNLRKFSKRVFFSSKKGRKMTIWSNKTQICSFSQKQSLRIYMGPTKL